MSRMWIVSRAAIIAIPVQNRVISARAGTSSSHFSRTGSPVASATTSMTTSIGTSASTCSITVANGSTARGKCRLLIRPLLPVMDLAPSVRQAAKNWKMNTPTTSDATKLSCLDDFGSSRPKMNP